MLEYILDASFIMYPLVLCSIIALAVILDRWRVFKLAEGNDGQLRENIFTLLEENRMDEAIEVCKGSRGPTAAVLLLGLQRFRQLLAMGRSITVIEANVTRAMDDFVPHVVAPLEKRIGSLSVIATVAPLLGMTGTVTGMINSFTGMSGMGGLEGNLVAAGVAEALVCTASGLIIAIPSAVAYHYFSKRLDHHVLEISRTGTQLIDFIAVGYSSLNETAGHDDVAAAGDETEANDETAGEAPAR
ncbi:MAG TPA: hypothetical protein DET40_01235 [Lentisphaeria bacterium]|nr:MAG: hypothetical protein A2X45_12645 [Lentisphaerae bacterium GWF2_50_93]HCE42155.1 hypothetical protein [Lentisphaeria bacterium]